MKVDLITAVTKYEMIETHEEGYDWVQAFGGDLITEVQSLRDMHEQAKHLDLHATIDANIWAKEFHRLNSASDLEMMRAWFANAIMCGYDHAANKAKKRLAAAEKVLQSIRDRNDEGSLIHIKILEALEAYDKVVMGE